MICLRCFHRPTLDGPGRGIQELRLFRSAYLSFFALHCLPESLTIAFLLDICCLVFLTLFVRALPTISPSINFSNSSFSLGPTEVALFATSSGSYFGSHAQTKYGGSLHPLHHGSTVHQRAPGALRPNTIGHTCPLPHVPRPFVHKHRPSLSLGRAQSSRPLVDNRRRPRILEPHPDIMVTVGQRLSSVLG